MKFKNNRILLSVILTLFINQENVNAKSIKHNNEKNEASSTDIIVPESAKSAIKALKKLEARCSVGISKNIFDEEISNAIYEVDMFVKTEKSSDMDQIKASIQGTLSLYTVARISWDYFPILCGEVCSTEQLKDYFKANPDANKTIEKGGILTQNSGASVSNILAYEFSKASKSLDESFKLVYK